MALIHFPLEIDYLHPCPIRPPSTAGDILDAATEAVMGGHPVVLREICRHLSLTPGAPYSHYENAAHLECVVTYNGFLDLAASMLSVVRDMTDPLTRVRSASDQYRRWALQHPSLFGFLFPSSGRRPESPYWPQVMQASQAVAIAIVLALRDGWDSKTFTPAEPGPAVEPLIVPGVVALSTDETRIANALWIATHGTVVLELAIGAHDGWEEGNAMFDWILTSNISNFLGVDGA